MAKATKAPTGITISRNGGTYTVSWKCGDKNYSKGQQFQYRINNGPWITLSIGAGTRIKAIPLNMANYFPATGTVFSTLSVRIRGKKSGGTWSAWSAKSYTNSVPNVPNLEASLDEQQTNKCTFTWNETTEATDGRPFYHVRWETILVEENDITDGSKLTWDSSQLGWETGAGSSASSKTITEDTSLLADASYTRWFRVCGRGARGSSVWRYAKHVYARPYQAQIEEANVTNTDAEGMTCYARWTADQKPSHPIDYTTVQYLITVPNSNLACPSGAQWTDANISADTADSDAVRFSIDDVLDKDECLFVRVNTVHDSNITYSEPYLASVGDLKDPTDLSYTPNNTAHTLTSVSVDNNSDVPDSFIVIVYKAGSDPENEIPVGIIAHGASQPLVTPVVCPDWSEESAFTIGAYAAVGSYSANTGLGYTVNVKMRSANTIWVGGAVPVAPENVNAVQSAIPGTATVTWDWTWTNATYAQLSWTDHTDAWESTDEPEIYTISQARATRWNISGLELGKKWYIAVRLVNGNPEDETAIYGPWSKLTDIILSSAPNIPSLKLSSNVITAGEEITASWDYVSNDGTSQIAAEIKDENDNLIAHTTIEKEVVIDTNLLGWAEGEVHSLSVRVTSESNRTTEWSNPVSIVVAEALEGSILETSLETKTVEVNPRSFDKTDFLSFITEQEEVFTKLQVDLDPIQDLHGYDSPWVAGGGKNKFDKDTLSQASAYTTSFNGYMYSAPIYLKPNTAYVMSPTSTASLETSKYYVLYINPSADNPNEMISSSNVFRYPVSAGTPQTVTFTTGSTGTIRFGVSIVAGVVDTAALNAFMTINYQLEEGSTATSWTPYSNICPISGRDSVEVTVTDDLVDPTDTDTYTTSLGTTVYGGTLNVVSGVLTVGKVIVDISTLGAVYDSTWKCWVLSGGISGAKVVSANTTATNAIASNMKAVQASGYTTSHDSATFAQDTNGYWFFDNGSTTTLDGTLCYELATPTTIQLTPQQIQTLLGQNNVWSEDGEITSRIAETYKDVLSLTQMPLTVKLAGVNDNIISTLTIERTADYHMDRPDETQFNGFEGEIVYLTAQNGGEDIIINQEDLIGLMDDEAPYRVFVTFKDVYGQSMSDSVDFEVHWTHQAIIPEAEVEIDNDNLVAILTPIAPTGTLEGDTCDIYRLSADKPELIIKNAEFGTDYVDPYPAIGEFGGHRFVFKTSNGDYITEDNLIAWTDTGENEDDILGIDRTIIDFNGNQLLLYYNVDVGHSWNKDFQETKYLGGSIQGDWNAGVSRTGSISMAMLTLTDAEQIRLIKQLAEYTGPCHVRTKDGSSFTADIQVSEDRDHSDYDAIATFSLTITRIDAETLDGLTYEQWAQGES